MRVGDGQGGRRETVRVQPGPAPDSGSLVQTLCQLEERQPRALGREVSSGTVQTLPGGRAPPSLPSAEK